MTDYAELKRLAEAAKNEEARVIQLAASGHGWEALPAQASFRCVASPETVLSMIAENERVKARLCICRDCGGQGEVYSGHDSYQGYNQPPEPDMDVCGTCGGDGVLGPLEDYEALAAERDQLRAEVAGLKTGYQAYEQVNAELKAEVEKLRKELVARHPFKFAQESPAIGFTGCVICGVYTDHGGLACPKMSPAARALSMENQRVTPVEPIRAPHPLEAAMGKGEQ